MPIYEYTCMDCRKSFTLLQRIGVGGAVCPWCNSANTAKQMSSFSCSPVGGAGAAGSGHTGGT